MTRIYPGPLKNILLKIGLVIISLVLALALAEGCLKLLTPNVTFNAAHEFPWMHKEKPHGLFTIDPGFGFRPNLGNGIYNQYGTLENTIAGKTPP